MSFLKHHKHLVVLFLLLFSFSLLAIYPLLRVGFPVTDDGTWLIIRFSAFFETLRTGQFPVRFIYRLNDGMGYPVSNFLYPLYLYLATPIHVLGFSFVNSIKALIIINTFLSAFFTFFWLRKKFNDISSFVGSIVLILSPYYLFDVYKRGSVGEILTFSIVPFILWQIERKSFIFLSIGFSLLILAHNSLAVLFLILAIFYSILIRLNFKLLIKSLILGLGLSAFFWIPALLDLSGTVFLNIKVSNFYDYFLKPESYYIVGISSLFIIVVAIIALLFNRKFFKDRLFIFFLTFSIIIIFLNLPLSNFFWKLFPFKDFIQFPFRLFSILTISLVFLAAFTTNIFKINKYIYPFILISVLIFQTFIIFRSVEIQNYEEGYYSTNQSTTTVSNEYLSKWFIKPEGSEKIQIVTGNGIVESSDILPGRVSFTANFETDGELQINNSYFPNWKVVANGIEKELSYTKNGLISFNADKGISKIIVNYEQSGIHIFSNLISTVSFILYLYLILQSLNMKRLSYTLESTSKNIKK